MSLQIKGEAMKKLLLSILFTLSLLGVSFSAPDTNINTPNSFTANSIMESAKVNEDFNEVQNKFNAHTHNDINSFGTVIAGTWAATPVGTSFGGTGNTYGIGLPSGAVFYMLTGSCPTGSTDITSTYADKFIKINATQNATGGSATVSHNLTEAELPPHTHFVGTSGNLGAAGTERPTPSDAAINSSSVGSGTAFTLDIVPPFVTCKLCQVN